MSSRILPLLHCPLCPPNSVLLSPTTLTCGHTVCASHVQPGTSLCPLPVCPPPIPDAMAGMRIPANSTVTYHPAVLPQNAAPQVDRPIIDHSVDVTVNKVVDLVARYQIVVDSEPQSSSHTHRRSHSRPSTGSDSSNASTRRPAKRRRRNTKSHRPEISDSASRFDKELLTELTCEICFMLYYQPVTTPCQHTFCAKCLNRSLDHNSNCPLCRQPLPDYAFFQDHAYNKVLLSLLLKAHPEDYAERARVIEEEERHARLDTPIFVCQLSFPGVPTVLHFFEPRYRLMLRRCLESPNPRFGMIMPSRDPSTSMSYGTMLDIKSVQMFPDGRSMVYTWGVSRFRILEKGSFDGYMVGRIETIEDYTDETDTELEELSIRQAMRQCSTIPLSSPADGGSLPEPALATPSTRADSGSPAPALPEATPPTSARTPSPEISAPASARASPRLDSRRRTLAHPRGLRPPLTNQALMNKCLAFVEHLREGNAPWIVQKMNDSYGPMPTDPAIFSFYMALALPIDDLEKVKLLPIKSPRLRLRLVVHWIDQLKSHWWFQAGCMIA